MLASRASLLSQALWLPRDSQGFDSPRPTLLSAARPNSRPLFAARKFVNSNAVRRIVCYATTSETGTVTSSEGEGSKPAEAAAAVKEDEKEEEQAPSPPEDKYEEYEVELDKPYGLRFLKGADGGTYIDVIAPGGSADKTKMFTVGDKVLATSAVFGTEIWLAAEYGRTMYTIRQRVGPLYMRMEKRYGKLQDNVVLDEKEIIRQERNSGVVSDRVREIQMQNYMRKMELKRKREAGLTEGLKLYREGKYEAALEKFESVLGSKPEPPEVAVTSYNVACCYSQLNQIEAGLSALEDAMEAGYEDYKTIRTDPDLANLRSSEKFKPLLEKYDEPFINENAINALKNIFGFNKK